MTGIEYPTITVGKHENLVVRFSLAAQLLMRRRGVDPAKIAQAMIPTNPDAVQNTVTIFSAMAAENFFNQDRPQNLDLSTAPSADYWATQIEDFQDIERVIWASLGKVAEERRKKLAAVPPMEAAS